MHFNNRLNNSIILDALIFLFFNIYLHLWSCIGKNSFFSVAYSFRIILLLYKFYYKKYLTVHARQFWELTSFYPTISYRSLITVHVFSILICSIYINIFCKIFINAPDVIHIFCNDVSYLIINKLCAVIFCFDKSLKNLCYKKNCIIWWFYA